jgi:hypothetical protein
MDARLALVSFVLLLVAAAAPIVWGWLTLLPAEREPFARSESKSKKPRDPFAVFLLVNVTFSLLLRIPGLDSGWIIARIRPLLSAEWADHVVMIGYIWFGFVSGLAAAYAAVRPNPLRWQLLVGGALTLLLWFAGPWLIGEIVGGG